MGVGCGAGVLFQSILGKKHLNARFNLKRINFYCLIFLLETIMENEEKNRNKLTQTYTHRERLALSFQVNFFIC